jgi:hypothetical protein
MSEEKNEAKETAKPAEGTPKAEAPKQEAPKQEAPKVEAPKQEAPKQEAAAQGTAKPEAPKAEEKKKEKPNVCAVCNKSIKKKRYYYRDGKFYCTKRCWKTTAKKESKEAKETPAEPEATK